MIKEKIASTLIKFANNKVFKNKIKKVYSIGLKYLLKDLSNLSFVEQVYLKSNMDSTDFKYGVSDLDFIVVLKESDKKIELKNLFDKWNNIFPFIKDFDCYLYEDYMYQLAFGGVKFLNQKKWKLVYGEKTRSASYVYYPLKFLADQLNELYFLLTWFNININKYSHSYSFYREENIKRNLQKIVTVLNWIEEPKSFEKKSLDTLSTADCDLINSILDTKNPAQITLKLFKYLESREYLKEYRDLLPNSFSWHEKNYKIISSKRYEVYDFKSEFDFLIPKEGFDECEGLISNIIIPKNLFELFHLLGCIDPQVLLLNFENNRNNLNGLFSLAMAYSKNIEKENVPRITEEGMFKGELFKYIKDKYILEFTNPINFLKKNTVVSVNWGVHGERLDSLLKARKQLVKQKGEYQYFHINLSIDKVINPKLFGILGTNLLTLVGDANNKNLWHKESLYNIAAMFAFSSKHFIFLDADVFSHDRSWFEKIISLLDQGYDFVHGFDTVTDTEDPKYIYESWTKKYLDNKTSHVAPGLVWGVQGKLLKDINYLPDSLPDGSCDGAFVQEMTGTKMGFVNNFKWYRSKIRKHNRDFKVTFCPVNVIHINHGRSRDYDNRGVLLDLVSFDFLEAYNKNSLGVYEWTTKDPSKIAAIQLKNLYYEMEPKDFVYLLDSLIEQGYISIPKTFKFVAEDNIDNYLLVENGISILFPAKEENSYNIISSFNNNDSTKIKLVYGGFDMMEGEYIHFKFVINNNGDYFSGKINYNWWKLFGANDLNYKYFRQNTKQIIELVPSSWSDHVPMFIHLDVQSPKPGNIYNIVKASQEHINMFHAWDLYKEIIVNPSDVLIKDNIAFISLGKSGDYQKGWYRIEYDFIDTLDQAIKISVVAGTEKVPITATRKLDNCNVPYKRIVFYKNHYVSNLNMFLKFIESKHANFGLLKIRVLSRRDL